MTIAAVGDATLDEPDPDRFFEPSASIVRIGRTAPLR
jgi:hypothetical protein